MPDSLFYHAHRSKRCWTITGALAALLVVATGAEPAAALPPMANMNWHEIDTAHFRILKWQASTSPSDDLYLKSTCEEAMTRVSTYWFGKILPLDRKCDVILYPSDESYSRAVGGDAAQTAGSVLTGYDGELPFFRIELRARRSDWETALPHELTHVLFAQRFAGRKLAGVGQRGDSPNGRSGIEANSPFARPWPSPGQRQRLPMAKLLSLNDYPTQRGLAGLLWAKPVTRKMSGGTKVAASIRGLRRQILTDGLRDRIARGLQHQWFEPTAADLDAIRPMRNWCPRKRSNQVQLQAVMNSRQ